MRIKEDVYKALMAQSELKALLVKDKKGRSIYPGVSPSAGSYPILVYSIISDVPALSADGEELEHRVTVRIQVLTRDGNYQSIYRAIQRAMLALGFMRSQTTELSEGDLFILCVDYKIGTGVDF